MSRFGLKAMLGGVALVAIVVWCRQDIQNFLFPPTILTLELDEVDVSDPQSVAFKARIANWSREPITFNYQAMNLSVHLDEWCEAGDLTTPPPSQPMTLMPGRSLTVSSTVENWFNPEQFSLGAPPLGEHDFWLEYASGEIMMRSRVVVVEISNQ